MLLDCGGRIESLTDGGSKKINQIIHKYILIASLLSQSEKKFRTAMIDQMSGVNAVCFLICDIILPCFPHMWYWCGIQAPGSGRCATPCSQRLHSGPCATGRRSGCPWPCSTHLESVRLRPGREAVFPPRLWSRRKRPEEGRSHLHGS